MLRAMCVGGPRDGETIETPPGGDHFKVPLKNPVMYPLGAGPIDPLPVQIVTYVLAGVRGWSRWADFWVPEGQTEQETINKLISGYRPYRPAYQDPSVTHP